MPSKRPTAHLQTPPSASSSASASSSTEEDDEEQQIEPSSNKPNSNSTPIPKPKPHSVPGEEEDEEEEEEEDESSGESGSDSDAEPVPTQNHAALDVKPISSKPMTTPDENKVKRRLDVNDEEEKDSRKDKKQKKVADLVVNDKKSEGGGDGEKRALFQRLWTEEDEILILKGIINFKKNGMDPSSQITAFFDFMKDSLRSDVYKVQLHGKIRSLKRKYVNNVKRVKNPGEDPKISKPHEAKVYELSKKAWGAEGGEEKSGGVVSVDGKKSNKKIISEGVNVAFSPMEKVTKVTNTTLPNDAPVVAAVKVEDKEIASEYTYLSESSRPQNFPLLMVPPGLVQIFSKRGWDVIGNSNAKGFDQRWKNVIVAEAKAFIERLDLVKEQTQMMLDTLQSSDL